MEKPAAVTDLAQACVRYVKQALGFDLDFSAETLPVVDQWLEDARAAVPAEERGRPQMPETLRLAVVAAGAYFGEVALRVHEGWWRGPEGGGEGELKVELARAFVSFSPMAMAAALVTRPDDDAEDDPPEDEEEEDEPRPEMEVEVPPPPESPFDDVGGFVLDEHDRPDVAARLAEIPVRTHREFYALSTKLEVLDLIFAALTAPHLGANEEPPRYEPGDYE